MRTTRSWKGNTVTIYELGEKQHLVNWWIVLIPAYWGVPSRILISSLLTVYALHFTDFSPCSTLWNSLDPEERNDLRASSEKEAAREQRSYIQPVNPVSTEAAWRQGWKHAWHWTASKGGKRAQRGTRFNWMKFNPSIRELRKILCWVPSNLTPSKKQSVYWCYNLLIAQLDT